MEKKDKELFLFNGYRVYVWSKEKVLEIVVMVTQHCEYN